MRCRIIIPCLPSVRHSIDSSSHGFGNTTLVGVCLPAPFPQCQTLPLPCTQHVVLSPALTDVTVLGRPSRLGAAMAITSRGVLCC